MTADTKRTSDRLVVEIPDTVRLIASDPELIGRNARRLSEKVAAAEACETCGDLATQWDYDQMMQFCDRHVQQADFTIPLEDR